MVDLYDYDKKERKEEQPMIEIDHGRRKKEQFIKDLKEGDEINDFFAVKIKNPPRPYKKGIWFDFIAADKTGEIGVKYWGGENKERIKKLYNSFSVGDVIQIRSGVVEIYDEKPQISINETIGGIRRCSPKEYDINDLVLTLEENKIKELLRWLKEEIKKIENEQLKKLLSEFFEDTTFIEEFTHTPSAITHHHNYIGGNLEHTVGVVRLCKNICEMYPNINRDLLVTGAILHDIGKLKEYKYGTAIEKTEEGNFIGHIVIGDRWIRDKIKNLREKGENFPKELENHLSHLILSHHGKYEWGSPRLPKTVEACILHYADLMDSQVKNYIQQVEEGKKITDDDWTAVWDPDLGRKRMMFLGTT
ncbi:MAG: HD family phosphohydrolase [Thermoplasmata archaeon]|nr:MAG: HD family phosphohydrolase [Thermoplasmata archaeon]RLF36201.1 MAG: HD family phosphohydrolase [Thermoplasmata archaeon]